MSQKNLAHILHASITTMSLVLAGCPGDDGDDPSEEEASTSSASDSDGGSQGGADSTAGSTAGSTTDDDPDPSDGSTSSDGTTSDDGADSTGDDRGEDTGPVVGPYTVAGTVVRARTATLWPGNDGIGSLQVALLESCEADAPFVVGTGVMDADFSEFGNTVDYLIEGVASGTYGIVGYMDDNGDLDPKAPGPNQGDLVFAEGAGPGCLEVEVLDADLEGADFPLTLALPF